jgi:hypothetical protein
VFSSRVRWLCGCLITFTSIRKLCNHLFLASSNTEMPSKRRYPWRAYQIFQPFRTLAVLGLGVKPHRRNNRMNDVRLLQKHVPTDIGYTFSEYLGHTTSDLHDHVRGVHQLIACSVSDCLHLENTCVAMNNHN